jgi:tRNA threonylcarbamoyladenosine biosynthesis protein TsaE
MKHTSRSLNDTKNIAQAVLDGLPSFLAEKKCGNVATVLGLYGDLGSGKTAFTQAIAGLFGVKEGITSPTFVIEKIYELSPSYTQAYQHVIHIDAYRLEHASELTRLGWSSLLKDPSNIILIEWPEKVAEIMPENHFKIHFTFIDEATREIEF